MRILVVGAGAIGGFLEVACWSRLQRQLPRTPEARRRRSYRPGDAAGLSLSRLKIAYLTSKLMSASADNDGHLAADR